MKWKHLNSAGVASVSLSIYKIGCHCFALNAYNFHVKWNHHSSHFHKKTDAKMEHFGCVNKEQHTVHKVEAYVIAFRKIHFRLKIRSWKKVWIRFYVIQLKQRKCFSVSFNIWNDKWSFYILQRIRSIFLNECDAYVYVAKLWAYK